MLPKRAISHILIGDFNAKIGSDEKGVQNGDKQISKKIK